MLVVAGCAVVELAVLVVAERAAAGRVLLVLAGCVVVERVSEVACVCSFSDALLVRAAAVACVVDVVRR